MTDRPILFSAPMVRALLAGTKTQTRRLLKPQPSDFQGAKVPPAGKSWVNKKFDAPFLALHDDLEHWCWWDEYANQGPDWFKVRWAKGDRLYVREHWYTWGIFDDLAPSKLRGNEGVSYIADGAARPLPGRFRQGMHMPRWASRLTLEVSDVRVERLQDISEQDAAAEGIEQDAETGAWWGVDGAGVGGATPRWSDASLAFCSLWKSINGPDSWDANPFVVAVSFTVHRGNIDQLARAS